MKIIPRFASGGKYSGFTVYEPIPFPKETNASKETLSKQKNDGELTQKNLFDMIKEIDGLPSEMLSIVKSLQNSITISNITGLDQEDIAITYLNNLHKIKIAADNKDKYKEAKQQAQKNGAWNELAIAMNGDLVVQDSETGRLSTVDLRSYKANRGAYKPLTVAQLGYLREYDPRLNMDQEAFNIIGNSMGYQGFQALLKEAVGSLGSTSLSRNGYFTNEGLASKGLEVLKDLSPEDQERIIQSGNTVEGLYKYSIVGQDQYTQIKALTSYLAQVMPDNAKTWAAIKLGSDNPQKAIEKLILDSLLPINTESHTFNIDYKGSIEHVMGKTSKDGTKSGSKEEDPKLGFWGQVQAGLGGTPSTFELMVEQGTMSVDGKFYGTTPGLEKDCSLNEYLSQSGVGHLRDTNSITFGDIKISTDSYNDVMIKAGSGAYVVTLPIKNGKVWLEAVQVYSNFKRQLAGLKEGTTEYKDKAQQLLNQPEYASLIPILQDGTLKPSNSRQFLVLEGLASNKTSGISKENKKESFKNIDSNFIKDAGDDDALFRTMEAGLSSKEKGEYKLDNNWISFNNDHIYKGNIYIPLNVSAVSAANADKNDLKESTVYRYEGYEQDWEKTNSMGSTSSKMLDGI